MFKKGDKLRLIDANGIDLWAASFTAGKIYTVVRDQVSDCVKVLDDKGEEYGPYARRFELVPVANGVDKDGNPKHFTIADFKPLQRAVQAGGAKGIIAEVPTHGLVIVYAGGGFDRVQINGEHFPRYPGTNIVEVYENPGYGDTYNQNVRGELVWKHDDGVAAAKAASIKAADEAVAKAREELAKAEAARAAI